MAVKSDFFLWKICWLKLLYWKNKNKDSGIFLKDFAVLTENLVHNVVLLELIRCVTIILRGLEV